jgi:hypothetical protein
MYRHFGSGVLLLVMVATTPTGAAADDKVLLLPLTGPSAREIQAKLKEALPPEVGLVNADQASRAEKVLRGRFSGDDEAYGAMGRKLGVSAILEGKTKRGKGWELKMTMRNGKTGAVVGNVEWWSSKIGKLTANIARQAPQWYAAMQDQLQRGGGEPGGPPEVDMRPDSSGRTNVTSPAELASLDSSDGPPDRRRARERAPSVEDTATDASALPIWEISVGPRVVARTFAYNDNAARLPGYTLAGAAGVAAEAAIFPAANSDSAIKNWGVAGSFDTTVSAKTYGSNGAASIDTTLRAYRAGLRYRMPVSSSFLITGGFDYGQDQVTINIPDAIPPNVAYGFVSPSLKGRVAIGSKVALTLGGAYLHVLDLGQLGANQRFPRDTARGGELAASIGYAIDDSFELRLAGDLRRYAHAMNTQTGDRYLVGGAVDEHFGASVLITYRGR